MQLTNKQKSKIPEQDILKQEETEKIKKEESLKTKFVKDLDQEEKEHKQVLNNYYGEY
jgi:truncated hemoglobin YjbI